jgi:8-oxo-dGTP pyrophosphatase MutT (NUDIX family)
MTDPRTGLLRSLLVAHQAVDDRESGYLEAMLALLAVGGSSLSRFSFDPGHFTASGFVVSPDRGSLLLVHHAKLGKWLQPGGHIETDDADVEAAARREVLEETGVDDPECFGLLDVDIHRFPERGDEPAHDHLDVRFGFMAGSSEAAAGDGTTEVGWFPVSEVAAWKDRRSLSRPARKLLGRRT